MITPLGEEMHELAKQISRRSSQAEEGVHAAALQLARKLENAGDSIKEIAEAAGVSRFAILSWLATSGLATRYRR